MDKSVERHADHTTSDSGVSFDSIETWVMQSVETTKRLQCKKMGASPVKKKQKVSSMQVTINKDIRHVNQVSLSSYGLLENISSDENETTHSGSPDLDETHNSDDSELPEFNLRSQRMHQHNWSPCNYNIDSNANMCAESEFSNDADDSDSVDCITKYLCRNNGQPTGFWELSNNDDIVVVTSKNVLFQGACLEAVSLFLKPNEIKVAPRAAKPPLLLNNLPQKPLNHDLKVKDWDLLSLHPSESWLSAIDEDMHSVKLNQRTIQNNAQNNILKRKVFIPTTDMPPPMAPPPKKVPITFPRVQVLQAQSKTTRKVYCPDDVASSPAKTAISTEKDTAIPNTNVKLMGPPIKIPIKQTKPIVTQEKVTQRKNSSEKIIFSSPKAEDVSKSPCKIAPVAQTKSIEVLSTDSQKKDDEMVLVTPEIVLASIPPPKESPPLIQIIENSRMLVLQSNSMHTADPILIDLSKPPPNYNQIQVNNTTTTSSNDSHISSSESESKSSNNSHRNSPEYLNNHSEQNSPSGSFLNDFYSDNSSTSSLESYNLNTSRINADACEENIPNMDIMHYVYKLCPYYGDCQAGKLKACPKIHNIESNMFLTSNFISQANFWDNMLRKFSHNNKELLEDLLRVYPQSLAESGNSNLLLSMVMDVLMLPLFDHTQSVRIIIFALCNINGKLMSYEEVILLIIKNYEQHTDFPLLCDVILSIIVERRNFLKYWPVMEEIFERINHYVDREVVHKIIKACIKQTPPYLCSLSDIYEKLLSTKLIQQNLLSLELLFQFMQSMNEAVAQPQLEASFEELPADPIQSNDNFLESKSLKDIILERTDVDIMYRFFMNKCEPVHRRDVVSTIVNLLKTVNVKEFPLYIEFLKTIFHKCLQNENYDLRLLLMGITANLLPLLRSNSRTECPLLLETVELIEIFQDDIETFVTTEIYDPEFSPALLPYTFKRLIYGGGSVDHWKLALRLLQLHSFQFPQNTNTREYKKFCSALRMYFHLLYKSKNYTLCKDVIVILVKKWKFDISGLQRQKVWDIFDFYREYVNHMLSQWASNKRDINIDAEETIFDFYPQLPFSTLRNVLILLYSSENRQFNKLVEMFDSCNLFYQQIKDSIFCNPYISTPEIWMQVHIFYYKEFRSNAKPKEVHFLYGKCKLPNVEPLRIPGLNNRDMDLSISDRVKHALRSKDFPLPCIPDFENRITVQMSKKILEQIRRSCPVL